jgi:integrase/recombinase XerD
MPAPLRLTEADEQRVAAFVADQRAAGLGAWRSTVQAARTFCGRAARAGGWERMGVEAQVAATRGAPRFVAWLLVTGRLVGSAELLARCDLRLGVAAARYRPDARHWFAAAARRLGGEGGARVPEADVALQWSTLAKVTAVTGVLAERVGTPELERAQSALVAAFGPPGTTGAGGRAGRRSGRSCGRNLAAALYRLRLTLFHAGRVDRVRRRSARPPVAVTGWAAVPPRLAAAARRYVEQIALSLRPSTVGAIEHDLREFGTWLAGHHAAVASPADLRRHHLEAYKGWLAARRTRRGQPLGRATVKNKLINLHCFFDRIGEWGYPDAPPRPVLFAGDLPRLDRPLPRFLDDAAAAKLLRAARADPDPLARLVVELLARTGMRKGELLALTVDAVVQIGSAYWLRIPLGKLHNDRYIPLHPHLKELLDAWLARRPAGLRSDRLLVDRGRPLTAYRVDRALRRLAAAAGVGHVTAHQLRHTLATQAINRGMSLDAIAALLGHKTLAMTMVYARIADKTVAEEYFAVSEKVEALYGQPGPLPASAEGREMRRLRAEVHRRMLGNGYCARPLELDCHFESICESCTFFVTTTEFRPTLRRQRDDAAAKGQVGRQRIFDRLLARLDEPEAAS